ncbi:hypothetical protein [Sphingomonas yabuuchiae]|uniref:Uncharacterized protein n=1 Tax=Sphingomonas yabuuchiae TaxID=172044 RepID=A0AA40ZZA4_9SPHN|nr:hypothetical protein [Sphingomonas yabuuchiae]MBB4611238.1 hypothetical protein [Sphingomonas yabuuchiae]MBN3557123.1 hypothetical protein [Sphingomonas yabuuchiae]
MTVGRDYMLKKTTGPSVPKFFIDTQIVPRLVNAVGRGEVLLDRSAVRLGVRPSILVAGAASALALLILGTRRGRPAVIEQAQPAKQQADPY